MTSRLAATFFLQIYLFITLLPNKTKSADKFISCDDPSGCDWVCPNNGTECNGSLYHCSSSVSSCSLTCTECNDIEISSSARSFSIYCIDNESCDNMKISANTSSSSIYLECNGAKRCSHISFYCPSESIENCKCINNGHNSIHGQFITEITKNNISTIVYNMDFTIPITTNYKSTVDYIYEADDTSHDTFYSRDFVLAITVLSVTLLITVSGFVYLSSTKRKQMIEHKVLNNKYKLSVSRKLNNVNDVQTVHVNDINIEDIMDALDAMEVGISLCGSEGPKIKQSMESMESMYEEGYIPQTHSAIAQSDKLCHTVVSEGVLSLEMLCEDEGQNFVANEEESEENYDLMYEPGNCSHKHTNNFND